MTAHRPGNGAMRKALRVGGALGVIGLLLSALDHVI
jgi:hypothetical protein